jgi:hypothetical protein
MAPQPASPPSHRSPSGARSANWRKPAQPTTQPIPSRRQTKPPPHQQTFQNPRREFYREGRLVFVMRLRVATICCSPISSGSYGATYQSSAALLALFAGDIAQELVIAGTAAAILRRTSPGSGPNGSSNDPIIASHDWQRHDRVYENQSHALAGEIRNVLLVASAVNAGGIGRYWASATSTHSPKL